MDVLKVLYPALALSLTPRDATSLSSSANPNEIDWHNPTKYQLASSPSETSYLQHSSPLRGMISPNKVSNQCWGDPSPPPPPPEHCISGTDKPEYCPVDSQLPTRHPDRLDIPRRDGLRRCTLSTCPIKRIVWCPCIRSFRDVAINYKERRKSQI